MSDIRAAVESVNKSYLTKDGWVCPKPEFSNERILQAIKAFEEGRRTLCLLHDENQRLSGLQSEVSMRYEHVKTDLEKAKAKIIDLMAEIKTANAARNEALDKLDAASADLRTLKMRAAELETKVDELQGKQLGKKLADLRKEG